MNDTNRQQKVHWEANVYDKSMSYVSQYGEDIVKWLNPKSGEKIIDFGCGTGDLAAKIASYGAHVVGVDISPEMVERARKKYPELTFQCADGMNWRSEFPYDAVFSNAALHWMKDPEAAIKSMISNLRPGGRMIVEFGGHGNVATIIEAIRETMQRLGKERMFVNPWYFPTIGEYAALLEKHGMEVRTANLFDRPTPLEDGEDGMKGWLEMFGTAMFPQAGESEAGQWIREAVSEMKQTALYDQGVWTADYRRIRVMAIKK